MKLNLLNVDEICAELPEISNWKIFENRRFSENGLFSLQIFGPLKSYHCGCSKNSYKGPKFKGRCPRCGVEIISCDSRKKRYGKITLPFELLNPVFYFLFTTNKNASRKIIDDMLSFKDAYYFDDSGILTKYNNEDMPVEKILIGLYGAKVYIKTICELNPEKPEFEFILNNFDQITMNNIIVIPPEFRPIGGKGGKKEEFLVDDLNHHYSQILKMIGELVKCPVELTFSSDPYRHNFKYLQKKTIQLYEYVLDRMSKKKGIIRSNILGKRVDFSGRAVISPDPTLEINQCRIPYYMVLEILKPLLIPVLIEKKIVKRYNHACKYIENCIKNKDLSLLELTQEFCKNRMVVINRQPTLHRLSVLGFEMLVHEGSTLKIHPMICPAFNADFDGDAMAVYFPMTEASNKDVMDKIGIWNNIISPTDINLVPQPNQDIILGVYTATLDSEEKMDYKGISMPIGRILFNKCLPEKHPVINEVVNEKKLKALLNKIALSYKKSEVITCLDNIKKLGFYYSTMEGYTISIDDFVDDEMKKLIDENVTGDYSKDNEFISENEIINEKLKNHRFSSFIDSGARGSWQQAKQLIVMRGYIADVYNKVRPNVIKSSLATGLTQKEFFESSYGCRKGLLDTAVSTGDSGYLTRQLIYSNCTTILGEEDDCGTTDYMEIFIRDSKMARSVLWRYYLNDDGVEELLTKSNVSDIIGKTIKLRSPIYCRNSKICKKCYGKLHTILHSNQCGTIATQAVGERATQLVLRTFHTSIFKDDEVIDVNNNYVKIKDVYDRVKNGEAFYTFSCSPEGRIEVSKVLDAFKDHITNKMMKITLDTGEICRVTPEHRMMLRNGEYKEAKDLVVGESLMPIKIYENNNPKQNYRYIKQNIKDFDILGYKQIPIYKISSVHPDCNTNNVRDVKIHVHHKDINKRNDVPTNLERIEPKEHYARHRKKIIESVKISNSERMKNPEYKEEQINKRIETWKNPELRKIAGDGVKKYYDENPGEGKRVSELCRYNSTKKVIDKLEELNLEKTNVNYTYVRKEYFNNHSIYCTFEYVSETYPELVSDFTVLDLPEKKSKETLHMESRMNKIVDKMIELGMEMTYDNFNIAIEICYLDPRSRISVEKMLEYSPGYLDGTIVDINDERINEDDGLSPRYRQIRTIIYRIFDKMDELEMEKTNVNFDIAKKLIGMNPLSLPRFDTVYESHNELFEDFIIVEKSKQQLNAESRMNKIVEHMQNNGIEATVYNFDKANEEVYPNAKSRVSRTKMLEYAPEFLDEILVDNHYVKSIEFITLDEEEPFYDLTVDSEYSNFPLSCGIFVHNSGAASGSGKNSDNEDIISGMNIAKKLFHSPEKIKELSAPSELVEAIYSLFSDYGSILMVHYEVIVSSMMWNGDERWRTMEYREEYKPEYVSILQVPTRSSWLLASAFANLKQKLLYGLISDSIDEASSITQMFRF